MGTLCNRYEGYEVWGFTINEASVGVGGVIVYYIWVFITNRSAHCGILKTSTDMRTAVIANL